MVESDQDSELRAMLSALCPEVLARDAADLEREIAATLARTPLDDFDGDDFPMALTSAFSSAVYDCLAAGGRGASVGAARGVSDSPADTYRRKREAAAERQRQLVTAGQEIGELPPIEDPERRARAIESFEFFCSNYFPETFRLPWSPYHRSAAGRIEQATTHGGMFAFAMPRGSGKTTLCEWGAKWALLSGRVRYVVLIGATAKAAEARLRNIKTSLRTNDLLLADFPEACYPIRCLGRSARKAEGQKYRGTPTAISWKQDELVLPTIAGAPSSGGVIQVTGLTGQIRGMNYMLESGAVIRPQLAICDDPQTRESAKSPTQSADRELIIAGDVAYLAGAGTPIAVVIPCTVIYEKDLADSLLDREQHPEFQGERSKMLTSLPSNDALWEEYAQLRADAQRSGADPERVAKLSADFYRKHRESMDAGAVASWPERYNNDEVSAVQHAMNLKLRNEAAFLAECQNEPLPRTIVAAPPLTADEIVAKINRIPRGRVPHGMPHLTAFVDVQQSLLFWMVAAWSDEFGGGIVDYGSWPDQQRLYWSLADAKWTIDDAFRGKSLEARLYAALGALADELLGREWPVDGGGVQRVERCLVDSGWKDQVVYKFCRQSRFAAILTPSKGSGITAKRAPLSERKRKPGERVGDNWYVPNVQRTRAIRHVLYDTNYWKSFVVARLAAPEGDRGSLALNGTKPGEHRMLADHLTAEFPQSMLSETTGRKVDEWEAIPGRDNHWLDCLVGSAVAAAMNGASLTAATAVARPAPRDEPQERLSLAERRALKRRAR